MTEEVGAGLAHAILGASGWHKWGHCTMAPTMEHGLPDEVKDWTREGTYGHAVGEAWLRVYLSDNDGPDVYDAGVLTDPEQTPEAKEFFTPEFAAHVQRYVDFVVEKIEALRAEHGADQVIVLLEQRLDFSRWVPEGFGTADVVIIVPGRIIVIDLKMGAGVFVDGENNGQLRLYALGAYERYRWLYDLDSIEAYIVQPRKDNISGETIPAEGLAGLLEWAEQVVRPRAAVAWAAREAHLNGGDVKATGAKFAPGEHCASAFCKARYVCPARARWMLEIAELPYALETPKVLSVEQLEDIVDRAAPAIKWLSDVERCLTEQAESGAIKLTMHEVAEGRSYREITDTAKAAEILMREGYAAAKIYKAPELVGLQQLERLVGAKKLSETLGDLLVKPKGAPKLRRLDSAAVSSRPAETATQAFGQYED